MVCLVAERTVNIVVLVLWRYPKYLRCKAHVSLERNHMIKYKARLKRSRMLLQYFELRNFPTCFHIFATGKSWNCLCFILIFRFGIREFLYYLCTLLSRKLGMLLIFLDPPRATISRFISAETSCVTTIFGSTYFVINT